MHHLGLDAIELDSRPICPFFLMGMTASTWPKWRERRAWLWPVLLMGTVTWCSGNPTVPVEGELGIDKIGHFAIFGALATAIIRCGWFRRNRFWGVVSAMLLTSVLGLGDEFRQAWGGVRVFDLHDWAADSVGALVAAPLYAYWPAYRRLFEMPLRRAKPPVENPASDHSLPVS